MADKTLEIKITADDKELEKSLSSVEKQIKAFAKQSAKASIDVDTAGALKKIESVSKKLKELEGSKKSKFDFVYGKSLQTINSVLDKLAKLDKYKNIKVGLDLASNVNKELAKLDKIKSKNVNISINTKGIDDATKKLNALYKVLSKIRKANKVIINTQIKDVGKLPKQALNNGSQSVKAQEASLRQIAKNYAGLAEQAWMDGDLKSFSQYRDMFRVAMNDLVNFKRALGDLSVGGEKTVYSNMARSLKDTSPLYNDIIKKVSQLDSEQKKFNDDVRNVGNAKQQYKTLSTVLREVTKEAERAWSVGDKKGFGIAKSQFNDISSLMTQLRKELGTLTVEQEIRSYEKMLRGMSATNPWLAVLKGKLEELYKEKAELDKIKNEIKAKLAPEKETATTAPRTRADYAKTLTALQQNVVARAEDYNKAFGTPEAEKAKKAYEGALTALLKFKQQQQGMLSYSSQKAVYNSVAPKIQRDSQAYELLRKRIQEATNATKQLNSTQGDKGALFGGWAQSANYATGLVGRMTKGWGSAMEAVSFFFTRVSQATGALGVLAKAMSVTIGVLAVIGGAFYIWGNAVGAVTSALQQLGQVILTALKPGYEVFVQSTKGILSLSAALRTMGNYQGQVVTKTQAMSAAVNMMNQAMYRAQQSAFSYQEIVQALQGVLPLTLGKGMNAQQALDITTGVAGVAKLTGLNQNQILQETRDLMQGTITARTSQVANALGISNEDLAQYKANSDELFKFLMDKFKNYSEVLSEYANTVPGSIEQLQETIGIAGQVIIDSFGGEIVSVVKTLTNLLVEFSDASGTVVDSNGKILASSKEYTDALGNQQSVVGLTIDSNKDLVDSLGNVVVKAEEVANQGLGLDAETTKAQLTEPMKEVVAVLQDVADYALYAAFSFVEWLKSNGYIEETGDTLETVSDILKTLIDFVVDSIEWWIGFADTLNTINNLTLRPLYLTLKSIANLIKTIVTSTSKLFVGDIEGARKDWDSFKNTLVNDFGKLGADLFFGKDKKKAIRDYLGSAVRSKTDVFEQGMLSKTQGYKSLADWYKFAEEKGVKPSSISGNQKQNEKANKEALKQAQKAFDAQKEALKNALD